MMAEMVTIMMGNDVGGGTCILSFVKLTWSKQLPKGVRTSKSGGATQTRVDCGCAGLLGALGLRWDGRPTEGLCERAKLAVNPVGMQWFSDGGSVTEGRGADGSKMGGVEGS